VPALDRITQAARSELRVLAAGDLRRVATHAWRLVRPVRADYRPRMRMRIGDWLSHIQRDVMVTDDPAAQCTWMGVRALKNPLDAWVYQEILFERRPDVVVELGSYNGGSTLFLAHMMDLIGHGVIVSVDIDRSRWDVRHDRIHTVTGDSGAPETVAEVTRLCAGRTVMVIHDADHYKGPVLRDLRAYAPLVSPGQYLVVEDGMMDILRPSSQVGTLDPGALEATEEFLAENPEFVVDPIRERFIATNNPRGFLRRVDHRR
jgi:cephalosporin hydroxylase